MNSIKPQNKNKQYLATVSLLSLLAINYGLQTNSVTLEIAQRNNEGFYELAQQAPPKVASALGKPEEAKPAPTKPVAENPTTSLPAGVSEGAANPPCMGCELSALNPNQISAIQTLLTPELLATLQSIANHGKKPQSTLIAQPALVKPTTTPVTEVKPVTVAAKPETDDDKDQDEDDSKPKNLAAYLKDECGDISDQETKSEKNEYRKCIKEAKKTHKEYVNNFAFDKDIEKIESLCNDDKECDLDELTNKFTKVAKKYSKKKVKSDTIKAAFDRVLGAELKSSLFSSDDSVHESALTAMDKLFELTGTGRNKNENALYSALQKRALDTLYAKEKIEANEVNKLIRASAANPKDTALFQDSQTAKDLFFGRAADYNTTAIYSNAYRNKTDFTRYYETKYLPNFRQLILKTHDTTGTQVTNNNNNDSNNNNNSNTVFRGTRGNQNNNRSNFNNSNPVSQNGQSWTLPQNSNGFRTGTLNNTRQGSRTAQ